MPSFSSFTTSSSANHPRVTCKLCVPEGGREGGFLQTCAGMVTKGAIHPLIGVQLHKWSDRRETPKSLALQVFQELWTFLPLSLLGTECVLLVLSLSLIFVGKELQEWEDPEARNSSIACDGTSTVPTCSARSINCCRRKRWRTSPCRAEELRSSVTGSSWQLAPVTSSPCSSTITSTSERPNSIRSSSLKISNWPNWRPSSSSSTAARWASLKSRSAPYSRLPSLSKSRVSTRRTEPEVRPDCPVSVSNRLRVTPLPPDSFRSSPRHSRPKHIMPNTYRRRFCRCPCSNIRRPKLPR